MNEMDAAPISEEHATAIRKMAHDLGNALEIIVQTHYLLTLGEPNETTLQWLNMMDTGVKRATDIGAELRRYLHEHGASK